VSGGEAEWDSGAWKKHDDDDGVNRFSSTTDLCVRVGQCRKGKVLANATPPLNPEKAKDRAYSTSRARHSPSSGCRVHQNQKSIKLAHQAANTHTNASLLSHTPKRVHRQVLDLSSHHHDDMSANPAPPQPATAISPQSSFLSTTSVQVRRRAGERGRGWVGCIAFVNAGGRSLHIAAEILKVLEDVPKPACILKERHKTLMTVVRSMCVARAGEREAVPVASLPCVAHELSPHTYEHSPFNPPTPTTNVTELGKCAQPQFPARSNAGKFASELQCLESTASTASEQESHPRPRRLQYLAVCFLLALLQCRDGQPRIFELLLEHIDGTRHGAGCAGFYSDRGRKLGLSIPPRDDVPLLLTRLHFWRADYFA